jgi:hypothetical protein
MIISLVTTEQSSNTEDTATSSFYQDYYGARRECWEWRADGVQGSDICFGQYLCCVQAVFAKIGTTD